MSISLVGLGLFAGSASLVYAARVLLKRSVVSATVSRGTPEIEDCAKVMCAKRGSVPVDVEAGKTYYYW